LIGPVLLPVAAVAWEAFNDLSATRGASSAGVSPISFLEIEAYQRVTGHTFTPLDVALITTADAAFIAEAHERATPAPTTSEAAE
jgi:hypothetical protein